MPERTKRSGDVRAQFGISAQCLSDWIKAGCPATKTKGGHYLYDLNEVRTWMDKVGRDGRHNGRSYGEGVAGADLREQLVEARLRNTTAQAAKHELAVAEKRGELVPRADVERFQAEQAVYLRAQLLALPAMSHELADMEDPRQIEARLSGWVLTILERWASDVD